MDRWSDLLAAVDSVRMQTLQPLQTIVVIDHNQWLFDLARTRLAGRTQSPTLVIESDGPKGLSGARNTGIAAAEGDIVAFLDDDAFADREWLRHLVGAYSDENVVAVGGRIVPSWQSDRPGWFPAEFDWVLGCTYRGMPERRGPVRNVIGANMSFRREALLAAGGFCSDLGRTADQPLGDEETEACITVRQRDPHAVVLYEPAAVVAHWVPDSRATWRYLISRCYGEGLSKARLTGRIGGRDGLSSERRHVLKTLPSGVAQSVWAAVAKGDRSGLQRAGAIVGGLAATVGGYAAGRSVRLVETLRRTIAPVELDSRGERDAPPRVLMVTPRFPPLMGGVENHVLQVARQLTRDGADVTVLTTDPDGTLPRDEAVDGFRVQRVRAWPKHGDLYIAPGLWQVITHGDWDLVHVQSYHTAVAPLAMLAALDADIPYVVTFHGGGHSSRLRTRLRSVQWALLRPLLARAARLIAVARFEADFFSGRLHIPESRFSVIPNGSDLPKPESDDAPDLPHPLLISIGRLEEYKGHHRVVAAMPELLRRMPDVHLLVLGSGPYRAEIERLAGELGVSEHVEVRSIPAADRRLMAATLAAADLVVLMSSFETHPLAIIEAVALGRPALVADTSGLRELAQDGLARAIPADSSPSEIADAIAQDLRHPRAIPRITPPTWHECAAGIRAVYERVLAERRAEEQPDAGLRHARLGRLPFVTGMAGCGMLAVALADNAGRQGLEWAMPLFWLGLLLAFAPAALSLMFRGVSRREAVGIVAVVGVALYIISILDNPTLFTGFDELLHYRTLDDLARTGRLFNENPLLPISPYFPGMEVVTHALMALTGMSGFAAGVTVIGVARLLTVVALYLLLERAGLEPRVAGLGVLMYMTAASFLYFDAQYGYESLALPLAILILYLLRESQLLAKPLRGRLTVLAALVVFAVIVTHHVTSYILTGTLLMWLLFAVVGKRKRFAEPLPGQGWVPLFALAAAFTWFAVIARKTAAYLLPHLGSAMAELTRIMAGESQSRRLFQSAGGQTSPVLERLIGLFAVALVLAFIAVGIRYVRGRAQRNSLAYLLGFGMLAYPASLALRFTQSGWQVGSRAMAFIYVGMAFVLANGLEAAKSFRRFRFGPFVLASLAVIMFAGGVIAGSTPHNRVASPYTAGAGKASIEAEGVGAASWARRVLGPGNRMVADSTNSTLMGSYGQQRTLSSADGVSVSGLFLAPEFGEYQRRVIAESNIEYFVVDRRIANVVPYQGYFFETWEKEVVDYGSMVSSELIGRYDAIPGASRVFDSGNIQIYDVRGLAR